MRLALLVLVLVGCADRGVSLPDELVVERVQAFDIRVPVPEKHDLLFVIDDSPAMEAHAARFTEQLPHMISAFLSARITDLHLGVIRAGADGFRTDGLVGSPFLIHWQHLDGTLSANYEGDLRDNFVRLATPGTGGPVVQQPLAALHHVLREPHGFLRADAKLVVVIVAVRDDASNTRIEDDIAALKGLKTDPTRLYIGTISERPAPRLDALVAGFPNRSVQVPMDGGYHGDVASVLATLGCYGGGGDPCLESPLFDVEPDVPGVQSECSFSDVLFEDETPVHEDILPRCADDPAARPCWTIEHNPANCPTTGGEVRVLRPTIHRPART